MSYVLDFSPTSNWWCLVVLKLLWVQVEEAEIKICEESGEKVDNKVRLDVLKKEEQMIAEENEELLQEEEEKRKKVSLADKRQV